MALLITQCLQHDFVAPIGRYEPLPNQLHIGYSESERLMGSNPAEGPVHTVMEWAYAQEEDKLHLIHIRDWHDPEDPRQRPHLEQFGAHCLKGTHGAEFVFADTVTSGRHSVVDASGLNDFKDTNLAALLSQWEDEALRVGLMGVWTEAKISFLAYELATRYPEFELAVCSALTAGSSRMKHIDAIEALEGILGVRVYPSVSAFTEFLTGTQPRLESRLRNARIDPGKLHLPDGYDVSQTDTEILLYLFRNSKSVEFHVLDGGYSGNVVLRAQARDSVGHRQVPHVVKIGPRDLIAEERSSFERIQEVLGNSAPGIVDFAEIRERGAIKYRYAGMLDGKLTSFQKIYMEGAAPDRIFAILDTVFQKQLGRFYDAAVREPLNLLRYYDFDSKYAQGVRRRVEALLGPVDSDRDTIPFFFDKAIPNVVKFYEISLKTLEESYAAPRYLSYLHGDLNGANILIDASDNVWLIDFFHTHQGHILKDLIKLENDLLYIFTPVASEEELREAMLLSDLLLEVPDLGVPPSPELAIRFEFGQFARAWKTLCKLRSFYPDLIELDRDPYQLYCGILRYAMHTLSFDECNDWQKKWALYTGSLAAKRIEDTLSAHDLLRVDEIPLGEAASGRIGITILPGRKDRSRSISEDIEALKKLDYLNVVCLITEDEFSYYGVEDLKAAYQEAGLDVHYFPIPDQGVPPVDADIAGLLGWIHSRIEQGKNVVLHCVGGLGRSGLVAALYLKRHAGMSGREAIAWVRQHRSPRALETRRQEEYVLG